MRVCVLYAVLEEEEEEEGRGGGGEGGKEGGEGGRRTFDRVRLCQLRAVVQQGRGQRVPFLLGRQAQVDVRGGEVVGVELGRDLGTFYLLFFFSFVFFCFFLSLHSLLFFCARCRRRRGGVEGSKRGGRTL